MSPSGEDAGPRNVAVVTVDVVAERMAGPAIRAFEMARHLSGEHHVRLVSLKATDLIVPRLEIVHAPTDADMRAVESWADVLVIQGVTMNLHPFIEDAVTPIVVDLYDPYHFELLEVHSDLPLTEAEGANTHAVSTIIQQLRRGDFFLCATEKQRDLWLGHLAAVGRVNPAVYRADSSLRSLVDVVPFGLSTVPPQRTGAAMRGIVEGISPDDGILLWAGGIYSWFDPLTLIRAVDVVRRRINHVRLVFMGTGHPNPEVTEMEVAREARRLSAELGLLDRHVFFLEGWVPYERRQDFLLDADVGVSTHLLHLETAYSFRTRMLDYVWAGLPIVTTAGDGFSALVIEHRLGRTVPPGDVEALAGAIAELLGDERKRQACAAASRSLARCFEWPLVLEPLAAFCRHPHRAADAPTAAAPGTLDVTPPRRGSGLRGDVRSVARVFREQGVAGVFDIVRAKLASLRSR